MMISKITWKTRAVLRTAVMAMAVGMPPLGFVYAQDLEAVERRLGGAVEAGELSLEQANVMMEALRRSSQEAREMEAKKHRFMQFSREIEEAVEAGKLSKEEAEKKMIAVRREMFEQEPHPGAEGRDLEARKRRFEYAAREIKEAREAGKISEEEAEEKLSHLRHAMLEQERLDGVELPELEVKERRYEQVAREIKEAHEAGKISEKEVEEKLMHLRREIFEVERRTAEHQRELEAKKRRYENATRDIKKAHEAGKISKEEAEKKLSQLRREMSEQERHDREESRQLEAK
jgi:hypothetical protein